MLSSTTPKEAYLYCFCVLHFPPFQKVNFVVVNWSYDNFKQLFFSIHSSVFRSCFIFTNNWYCVFSTSKVSEEQRRLRREKDEIQTDRQTVYREETRIAHELNNLRDELARTEHNLRSITGKGILNGLDSVRKVSNCHIFSLHGL